MLMLTTPDEFDALLDVPLALVYKHSSRCPISAMAYEEVEALEGMRPDVPVYLVDVIDGRALSRHVAARTGVFHHSPQAILLVAGRPAWSGSHFEVRAELLARKLDAVVGAGDVRGAA
jgi:bacillithiol system protein YtxJ